MISRVPIIITNENDYYATRNGNKLKRVWSHHIEKFRKVYPVAVVNEKNKIFVFKMLTYFLLLIKGPRTYLKFLYY